MRGGEGTPDGEGGRENDGLTRRRFVQVCVGVATAAAVGSTLSSFIGLRSPIEVKAPPRATQAVAVCSVCSLGCGLTSVSSEGRPYPPKGDPQSSSTSGMVCTRGALPPEGVWPATLERPMKRISPTTKGQAPSLDQFETVDWTDAISDLANVLIETGIAFDETARGCILGGDVALEDAYLAAKIWKGALSSPSIDSVDSLHTRASDAVFLEQLGEVASPTCLNDIGLADLIVVVGEDLANTHPVAYARVAEAVTARGATLVVIDPRVTATSTRTRCLHVPVRAGGEVALLNAVGNVLVHELGVAPDSWALDNTLNATSMAEFLKLYAPEFDENERVDAEHLINLCDGPSEWVADLGNRDAAGFLKSFDVPTITGVDPATVRDLAHRWNLARNVLTIWSTRLAGAGDDGAAVSSVVDLHLLTGQMGRPGAGPMGLSAHAGGRGVVEAGASPMTLPGSVPAGLPEPPSSLVETWGLELAGNASRLPVAKGVMDILIRARAGELPVLLLTGGSVSAQLPDADGLVTQALASTYVVSTAGHVEDPDVAFADLVLPRCSWYEREAHYISSERKLARSLPSMPRPDGPWTELETLSRLGSELYAGTDLDLQLPMWAMEELQRATVSAPADISAVPAGDGLTDSRGMQWPVPDSFAAAVGGNPRRHMGQDGRRTGFPTPTGRALVMPREHPGLHRPPSPDYPLTALVCLEAETWWDGLQFQPSGGEVVRAPRVAGAYVEMTAEDAGALGLVEGVTAHVTSPQGTIALPVRIAPPGSLPGHVAIPWGADARVGVLPPSFPLDSNGIPPWTAFSVVVSLEPPL